MHTETLQIRCLLSSSLTPLLSAFLSPPPFPIQIFQPTAGDDFRNPDRINPPPLVIRPHPHFPAETSPENRSPSAGCGGSRFCCCPWWVLLYTLRRYWTPNGNCGRRPTGSSITARYLGTWREVWWESWNLRPPSPGFQALFFNPNTFTTPTKQTCLCYLDLNI